MGRAVWDQLFKFDWTLLPRVWSGVFWHESTKSMLLVYSDDFILAANAELHNICRKDIKSVIDMGDETTDGRFLGCVHERYTTTASKVHELLESQPQHHPRPLGNDAQQEARL